MVIKEHEATAKNVAVKEGEPSEAPPNNYVQERVRPFASRISDLEGLLVNAKEDLAREAMIRELEDELLRRLAREALENEVFKGALQRKDCALQQKHSPMENNLKIRCQGGLPQKHLSNKHS